VPIASATANTGCVNRRSKYLLHDELNKLNQLIAKLSTVSWKIHQWWAHAHAWNQPTVCVDSWQMTWVFRVQDTSTG